MNYISAQNSLDFEKFELEWTEMATEICKEIYKHPEVQELKKELDKKGFLTLEEKSKFIDIADNTKYALIYEKYGLESSEGYKNFSTTWSNWFREKGVESQKVRNQKSSVDHIIFGSTPEPEEFLNHFEEEIK